MKVLITCGPTWVAIDEVRVLSNISTGEMGHLLAGLFKKNGAQVTLIEGQVTHAMDMKGIKVLKFKFFDELKALLLSECRKKYDCVIHVAAVSDFKPAQSRQGKISSAQALQLSLVPTDKIINRIKTIAPDSCLVGFKLEPKISRKNLKKVSQKLISEAGCDAVLVNALKGGYQAYIIDADGQVIGSARDKKTIAQQLIRILS